MMRPMYVQLTTTIATITVDRPGLISAAGAAAPERARRRDPQGEQKDRERQRDVDHARDHGVGRAAVETGEQAGHDAEPDGERGRDERDLERDPRAVDDAREDVAPDRVDAEQEVARGAGRRPEVGVEHLGVLRVRRVAEELHDPRREDRHEDLEHDEAR